MPPRRRRAGYRPGDLSQQLRDAIAAEAELLSQVETDLAMVDAVSETLAAVEEELDAVRMLRWEAIASLRAQGWSYDRMAAATSLSKTRVRQLAAEARERVPPPEGDAAPVVP